MDSVMRFLLGSVPSSLDDENHPKGGRRKRSAPFNGKMSLRVKLGSPGKPILDLEFRKSSHKRHGK
jgi:hypothetical protein